MALQKPPLSVAALSRQIRQFAAELGEPAPSYWVIYDIVRRLPGDLLMLAHRGAKAYCDIFDLVHRREASGPNAIWQPDHTPLDILLVRADGSSAKPWLTIVIDDYGRAVAGYLMQPLR